MSRALYLALALAVPLASLPALAQTSPAPGEGTAEPSEPSTTTSSGARSSPPATTSPRTERAQRSTSQPRSSSAPASRSPRSSGDRDDERPPEDEEDEWGSFYIQLLGGYSFANLIQFRDDNFLPTTEKVEGSGAFGGLGLGFRVHVVTIGAQATLASYFGFEVGTAAIDFAIHLPTGPVQPYFRVGFGYAWMGKANYETPGLSETDVFGFVIDGGFGLNFKLARALSIGVGLDAAYLNLGRQAASDIANADDVSFDEDGDAIGLQVRAHAHLTIHI